MSESKKCKKNQLVQKAPESLGFAGSIYAALLQLERGVFKPQDKDETIEKKD